MVICHSCNKIEGVSRKGNLTICKMCWSPKSDMLINKTRAMQEYALPADQLKNLRHALKKNSFGGNNDIILFLHNDIKKRAVSFYGSLEKSLEEVDKRKQKREERKNRTEQLKQERHDELNNYLISKGLGKIRKDSYICDQYVEHGEKSGYTIVEIGEIMAEMYFYYNYTQYKKLLAECYKDFKNNYDYDPDMHDIVREEAKEIALQKYVYQNAHNQKNAMNIIPSTLHDQALEYFNKCHMQQLPVNNIVNEPKNLAHKKTKRNNVITKK